jgi:hypothetical protein
MTGKKERSCRDRPSGLSIVSDRAKALSLHFTFWASIESSNLTNVDSTLQGRVPEVKTSGLHVFYSFPRLKPQSCLV